MRNATVRWTSLTLAALIAVVVSAQNAPPPTGGAAGQPSGQAQQAPPGARPGGTGEAGARQGRAEQGRGAPQRPAWEEFQLDPNRRIELRFRNANADLVFELYGRVSGITILKDPNLRQTLTVTSPRPVSLREAFEILDVALSLRGFGLRKQGNMLIAGPRRQERNPFEGLSPEQVEAVQNAGRTETRVYPIRHANAAQVERVVRDVFGAMTRNEMMPFMFGFDFGAMQAGGDRDRRGGQRTQGDVRVSSDDFSNSVIVNAPRTLHPQIEQLIREIDKPSEAPMRAQVYRLEFAVASEVAPIVQNVLVSNAPRGRGGAGNQQVSPFARMGVAMRFGNADVAFGSVLADERSNSLVVTATEENHQIIAQVIQELDQEVEVVDTTFVLPLNNARADEMAQLLNSSFGGRVGGGFGQMGGRAGQGRQWQQQQGRRTGGQRNAPRTGRSVEEAYQLGEQGLELMLEDPSLDVGELMTVVAAQPFQFWGGGGGQRRPGAQAGAPARGADGRLVNVRDLEGQVSIISDPNTNSLIIVTDPQNMDLIRSIVEQLDRIPEQVMIETIIVEASLDSDTKLGVEWTMVQDKLLGNPGVTGAGGTRFGLGNATPPLEGFNYSVTGGNVGGFLHILQTDDRFHVLSTPRIFTANNVEAEINISQRVPYVVSQREDAAGNITFNYAFEDVGIVLRVTPRITANGYVTLDVVQTANDLQGFTDFNAPIVNQRQAQTTVAVMDGETIILGGIIRTTVTSNTRKLPILGDIPILGNLFRTTSRNNQKTELLVFLTPRVVRNPDDARRLREGEQRQLSENSQRKVQEEIGGDLTEQNQR